MNECVGNEWNGTRVSTAKEGVPVLEFCAGLRFMEKQIGREICFAEALH